VIQIFGFRLRWALGAMLVQDLKARQKAVPSDSQAMRRLARCEQDGGFFAYA
jgi:hypothetical protein